ncbi:MAG TPA: hypothetical protein VGH57_29745 [Amycolatopsis sp.]
MNLIGKRMVRAGAAVAGVAVASALAGCGLSEAVTEKANGHVKTVEYQTGTEGKASRDVQLPGWVPDQAQSVSEVIRTTGSERILRYTAAGAKLPATCLPGPAPKTAPTLTADWWPNGQETKADKICDAVWHVSTDGTTVYAYKPETIDQRGAN